MLKGSEVARGELGSGSGSGSGSGFGSGSGLGSSGGLVILGGTGGGGVREIPTPGGGEELI